MGSDVGRWAGVGGGEAGPFVGTAWRKDVDAILCSSMVSNSCRGSKIFMGSCPWASATMALVSGGDGATTALTSDENGSKCTTSK
jgi:hypothetical protein